MDEGTTWARPAAQLKVRERKRQVDLQESTLKSKDKCKAGLIRGLGRALIPAEMTAKQTMKLLRMYVGDVLLLRCNSGRCLMQASEAVFPRPVTFVCSSKVCIVI